MAASTRGAPDHGGEEAVAGGAVAPPKPPTEPEAHPPTTAAEGPRGGTASRRPCPPPDQEPPWSALRPVTPASSEALVLDHDAYPHIIDEIVNQGDWQTWVALRGASNAFKTRVDDLLRRHIVLTQEPGVPGVVLTSWKCSTRIARRSPRLLSPRRYTAGSNYPHPPQQLPGTPPDVVDEGEFDRAIVRAHVIDLKGALDPPLELLMQLCPRVLRIVPDGDGLFYRGIRSFSSLAYHLATGQEYGTLVVFPGVARPRGGVHLPGWMSKVVFNVGFSVDDADAESEVFIGPVTGRHCSTSNGHGHQRSGSGGSGTSVRVRQLQLPFNVESFEISPIPKHVVFIFPDCADVLPPTVDPLRLLYVTLTRLMGQWNLDQRYTVVNLEGVVGHALADNIPFLWVKELCCYDTARVELAMENFCFVTKNEYRKMLEPGEWELETML